MSDKIFITLTTGVVKQDFTDRNVLLHNKKSL